MRGAADVAGGEIPALTARLYKPPALSIRRARFDVYSIVSLTLSEAVKEFAP